MVGYFVSEWSAMLVGADLWPLGAEICWALILFTGRASILFFCTQLSNDVDEWWSDVIPAIVRGRLVRNRG